ncbi:hypothetical protein [Microcoleus sp. Z1_C4]
MSPVSVPQYCGGIVGWMSVGIAIVGSPVRVGTSGGLSVSDWIVWVICD